MLHLDLPGSGILLRTSGFNVRLQWDYMLREGEGGSCSILEVDLDEQAAFTPKQVLVRFQLRGANKIHAERLLSDVLNCNSSIFL